jgi:GntR family transcriptional regulator / MocR family aminotransferase
VPESLIADVTAQKAADDLGTPIVDQLALADFIAHGELDRHLRASRLEYRRRRDALIAALARHLPETTVGGIAAGLQCRRSTQRSARSQLAIRLPQAGRA